MYPVGHSAVVHCALFSYSGSGGITQRNSCIFESLSSSFAPFTSAVLLHPCVCGSTAHTAVLPKLIAPHWCAVWGRGFGVNDNVTLLVYPVLIARCQGSSSHQAHGWGLVQDLNSSFTDRGKQPVALLLLTPLISAGGKRKVSGDVHPREGSLKHIIGL